MCNLINTHYTYGKMAEIMEHFEHANAWQSLIQIPPEDASYDEIKGVEAMNDIAYSFRDKHLAEARKILDRR